MNAFRLLRHWCFGLIFVPCVTFGQTDIHPAAYAYSCNDLKNTVYSNVPLNEINSHAWRSFHRLFPTATGGENWFYSEEGYRVSFTLNGLIYQAFFGEHGGYRYSLHHYAGKDIPREPGDLLRRKYPDYQLNIVTEITDGEKIVYLVRLVSATNIETISLCDGEVQVVGQEHISDPTQAGGIISSTAGLTSRQSYP